MTIVEIMVVVVIIGLLIPLFSFIMTMYFDAFALDDKLKMSTETRQALHYIDDSVRISNSFMTQVPAQFSDPYGPRDLGTAGAEAWSYKGNSTIDRVLIVRGYATSTNALNTERLPVFVDTPEYNCTTEMQYQPQLTYLSIYFVKNQSLYKRTLTNTTTSLCAGNVQMQKQSCSPTIPVGSRNPSCLTNDELLVRNVTGFSLSYYQIITDGTDIEIDPTYASTDPDILVSADYVLLTITTGVNGGSVTNTVTQRMTKVNQS